MAKKKFFTESSLSALIDEIKTYVINAVSNKADSTHTHSASDVNAYSKSEIDNIELITVADIDAICGSSIVSASEVMY